MNTQAALDRLAIVLPDAPPPVANYVPSVLTGSLLFVSGQLPLSEGRLAPEHAGKVGADVNPKSATAAARLAAINILAQARSALGSLDRVRRVVRLGGFIAAAPDFTALPGVMNGASDLVAEIFGEAGRHARTTVGVAALPLGACVEIEALFEVAP